MLLYTITSKSPIFYHCDMENNEITVAAYCIDDINQRKLLPIQQETTNIFDEGSPEYQLEVFAPSTDNHNDRFLTGTLWIRGGAYPVNVKRSVLFTQDPVNVMYDYSVRNLYAPMVHSVSVQPKTLSSITREACVNTIYESTTLLHKQLRLVSFQLNAKGKELTTLLHGTPPSGDDRGDAIKFIGEMFGRALSSSFLTISMSTKQRNAANADHATLTSSRQAFSKNISRDTSLDLDSKHIANFKSAILLHANDFTETKEDANRLINILFESMKNIIHGTFMCMMSNYEFDETKRASVYLHSRTLIDTLTVNPNDRIESAHINPEMLLL